MDLDALSNFASENAFNLTSPLDHAAVVRLAEHWLPQIRFHWKERFHPIGLRNTIDMPITGFSEMAEVTKAEFRLNIFVKDNGEAVPQNFDPPVVMVPDGAAPASGTNITIKTNQILTDGLLPMDALQDEAVKGSARLTSGASAKRAGRFFGASNTILNSGVPAPGDPLVPKAMDGQGRPLISIMATYQNLLETFEYNLRTQLADDYPPDMLRKGMDIGPLIIRNSGIVILTADQERELMLSFITAHKNGDPLPSMPPGYKFNDHAWDALTRYAFLEYGLSYAYNDFDRYQTTLFENEHEGDDEGFCLVFDRNLINLVASSNDESLLLMVPPHSIISSAHEEWQDVDNYRLFTTPSEVGR